MNIKYIILSIFLFLLTGISLPAIAQKKTTTDAGNITVTGVVLDESGNPCAGATVVLAGNTTKGVSTNIEGKFTIVVPPQSKLRISYVGYESQTITNLTNPRVVLKELSNTLNEVVSVGYGSMKGKNITGAVEVIRAEELKDLAVSNLSEALVAISPSVHVDMPNTGRPGETASITIRQARDAVALVPTGTDNGGKAIGGDNNPAPLYVIDDFISNEDNFNNLDIDEVESITILKDASAAVYGAYGAYGVILVKTKRGKQGTPKISYSTQYGYSNAIKHASMLNAYDYGLIYNAAQSSEVNKSSSFSPTTGYFQADELNAMKGMNYNLLKKYWSPASTQRHSINVSGGNEKVTYFGGISYFTEDGNIGKLDYDRWNYRAGLQAYVAKWFRADLNVSGDAASKDSHMSSTAGNGSEEDYSYMLKNPTYVPDEIEGYPIYHSGMQNSPVFSNYYNYKSLYNSQNNRLQSANAMTVQASLEHQFDWWKPLKGLRLRFTYAKYVDNEKQNDIRMSNTVYRLKNRGGSGNHLYVTDPTMIIDDPLTTGITLNENTLEGYRYVDYKNFDKRVLNDGQNSYISRTMSRADNYQMNLMLTYARDFNNHHLNGSFTVERSENESEDVTSKATAPLPFTDGQSASVSDLSVITSEWTRSEGANLSYIGRMNYSYADKYLFQVLFRAQASTKFAPENYWGTFPSLSAGWVASEEKWFKKFLGMDFLKFRINWGLMGRDNVLAWKWLQLYDYNKYDGSIFGTNPAVLSGRSFQLPEKSGTNRNLKWDKNYMTNFGIDARMLNDRLSITFDAYYNKSRDMFLAPSDENLPGTVGIYPAPENYGAMDTYGAEIQVAWRQRFSKDAYLSLKLGTGYDDNKILVARWDTDPTFTSLVYGERADRGLWGYSCVGMFRSYQQIEEYFKKYQIKSYLGKTQSDVRPGMLIYEDIRGHKDASGNYTAPDGIVDAYDYVKISNRADNPYNLNGSINFVYKQFMLNATIQAEWGAYTMYPSSLRGESFGKMETTNISTMWKDMYVYDDLYDSNGNQLAYANRDGKYPNILYSSQNSVASTFWRISAAQIYLRNISVAYSLPKQWIKSMGMSSVRINATCQNALSFYNALPHDAWDNFAGSYGSYPITRTITMGVNVSF